MQGGESRAKYGNKLIKEYSIQLSKELGKGYSVQNLKEMRQYYLYVEKGRPMGVQLEWSHYRKLMYLKNDLEVQYYISQIQKNNLTKRQLETMIKTNEYGRLPSKAKEKLIKDTKINNLIKNPILIKNSYNYQNISEKLLKKLILEDIESFMKELGNGYTYAGNEYKIKIDNRYNYIDLLFFNTEYNCYVVVELKVTEYKAEYLGQILKYVNYIDLNIKKPFHDKTIGIIICKENNQFVLKYSTDERIYNTTYELV